MAAELFKVEQYVEMVLQYLRSGGSSTDYLIAEVPLEPLVRQAVRKYAPLFIRSRVTLDLQPIHGSVLSDEKWLGFVVEQLLSNAVKYTRGGTVRILQEGSDLLIQDTGIGIAAEDLPRIFEKGYTGCNGRTDKKSTGIGLASACTCAKTSATAWAMLSPSPPSRAGGQRSASPSSAPCWRWSEGYL